MSTETEPDQGRYRRRILGLGAFAFVVLFAVGAAIFIPVVQNDLTDRLTDRLEDDGVPGVSVSFSGQDGTLECDSVLDDPDEVKDRAESLHGVRAISLDESCTEEPRQPAVDEPVETTTTTEAPDNTPPTTEAPEPEFDTVAEIVDSDSLFGELSRLVEMADLGGEDGLGGDGPFTVLAPTDAAFDAAFSELGPDAINRLISDPELLRSVLLHHVIEGEVRSTDLETGTVTMLDGTEVDVDADAITFTSGDVVAGVEDPATQLDIQGSNGVVHAIDQVLLPEGLDLSDPNATTTTAEFTNGQIVLSGTVESDEQRQQLIAAAEDQIDPANVIDDMIVRPDVAVVQADVDRLASLVETMPANLVSGTAELTGSDLSLTGVYLDEAANTALTDVAASNDAETTLTGRDLADADSAQELQDELNEFVRLNPVLFEPSSTDLTDDANAVIEQIAVRAQRLDGINILITGYTDTDGLASTNQTLSEGRAATVLDALVAQGLDDSTLSSDGLGATVPILDDAGVEDKAASRRVEFTVSTI